jgi:hypothetical protein
VEIRPVFLAARMVVTFVVHVLDTVKSTSKAVWDSEDLKTELREILNERNFKSDIMDLRVLNIKGKCTLCCIRQNRQMSQQGERLLFKLMA